MAQYAFKPKLPVKPEDIEAYERGWADEMVKIWKEKIIHYKIRHTGALYSSVGAISHGGSSKLISHKFLLYGLYQDLGVGKEKYKGNKGDAVLSYDQRKERREAGDKRIKLHARERRPWYSKKYYASVMKLNDVEGIFYGAEYQGLLADCVKAIFEGK